jgi:hypothetical protein
MATKHLHLYRHLIFVLAAGLLLSCAGPRATVTPALDASPTPAASQTATAKPSPTVTATPSPAPTNTQAKTQPAEPTQDPESKTVFVDASGGIKYFENYNFMGGGVWSPNKNEVVFWRYEQLDGAFQSNGLSKDYSIIKIVLGPDSRIDVPRILYTFKVQPLFDQYLCSPWSLLWSRDGKSIYSAGPLSQAIDRPTEDCGLWVHAVDGGINQRFTPEFYGRDLSFLWMGWNSLVTSVYTGGGSSLIRILNVSDGQVQNAMWGRWIGDWGITPDYLGATSEEGMCLAVALYRNGPKVDFNKIDRVVDLATNFARKLTDVQLGTKAGGSTFFNDFYPGTNLMLVYRQAEIGTINGDHLDLEQIRQLLLWNLDTDEVSLQVPYAYAGKFGPDRKTLAYVTLGRADLDEQNRPKQMKAVLEGEAEPYLQLLDLPSKQVFLSLPIYWQRDTSFSCLVPYRYIPAIWFSPDGHSLAFLSDQELAESGPGKLEKAAGSQPGSFLYVYDLNKRKLVWSRENVMLPDRDSDRLSGIVSWNPKGDKFVYRQQDGNLILQNLITGNSLQLTKSVGRGLGVSWSYDGSYLLVEYLVNDQGEVNLYFLRVP